MNPHGPRAPYPDVSVPRDRSAGVYGRLFPSLPPYVAPGRSATERVAALARAADRIDDSRSGGGSGRVPERLVENRSIPAGYTFLGQLVAHDLTHDPSGLHQRAGDPEQLRNYRTPRLDLDTVYGSGPRVHDWLYDQTGEQLVPANGRHDREAVEPERAALKGQGFLLEWRRARPGETSPSVVEGERAEGNWPDLPRNRQHRALVPDPRNDSHPILSQLTVAVMCHHNRRLRAAGRRGLAGQAAFEEAARLTRWHYQWVVVHRWLPALVGSAVVKALLPRAAGGTGELPSLLLALDRGAFVPVELTAAVLRAGHAMVRETYAVNEAHPAVPLFGSAVPHDPARPRDVGPVDWRLFVRVPGSDVKPQPSRILRPRLVPALGALPQHVIEHLADLEKGDESLARRDLLRGEKHALPSGQAIARALGVRALPGRELPLWIYVLQEANELEHGLRMGPVGARILADSILALLRLDPRSWLARDPAWKPRKGRGYDLADFLADAGVLQLEDDQVLVPPAGRRSATEGQATAPRRTPAGSDPRTRS